MDIITLALAKKFAKEYADTHTPELSAEDIEKAISNYLKENPNTVITGDKLTEILDNYFKKEDLSDLETIRSGAALGATALQEHQDISGKVDRADIENVIYYEDGEESDVDEVVLMSEFEAANNELKQSIAEKLTEPTNGIEVGKYFRVASIDENGHAILECVDAAVTAQSIENALGYAPISEESINEVKDAKQDKLIAGENITLSEDGKTISASCNDFTVELIESITLTEQTNSILRTQEPDGTNYNFKGYIVTLDFPDGAGESSLSAYARQGENVHLASVISFRNWSKMKVRIEINANSGSWNGYLYIQNANGVAQNMAGGVNGAHFTSNILSTRLKLDCNFPSGTVINIYAARG